jgi:PIF1-like helicase
MRHNLRHPTTTPSRIPSSLRIKHTPGMTRLSTLRRSLPNAYLRRLSTQAVCFSRNRRGKPTKPINYSSREVLPNLSPEQQRVLDLVKEGHNVFFTGPAGTGKSLILKHLKKYLQEKNADFALTATTGIAAGLIEGRTVHSWSGLQTGKKGIDDYLREEKGKRVQRERPAESGHDRDIQYNRTSSNWLPPKILIIDEISMVCSPFFCPAGSR